MYKETIKKSRGGGKMKQCIFQGVVILTCWRLFFVSFIFDNIENVRESLSHDSKRSPFL